MAKDCPLATAHTVFLFAKYFTSCICTSGTWDGAAHGVSQAWGRNSRPRLRFVPNRSASRWEAKRLITSLGSDTVLSRWCPAEIRTTNARVRPYNRLPAIGNRGAGDNAAWLSPAGFYEWQVLADGKTKIPLYIQVNDQKTFAFAGLWDSSETDTGAHRNPHNGRGKTVWLAIFTTPSAACRLSLRTPTGKLEGLWPPTRTLQRWRGRSVGALIHQRITPQDWLQRRRTPEV